MSSGLRGCAALAVGYLTLPDRRDPTPEPIRGAVADSGADHTPRPRRDSDLISTEPAEPLPPRPKTTNPVAQSAPKPALSSESQPGQ